MVTVRATCLACNRDVTLDANRITLTHCADGPRYTYQCPRCHAQCSRPATPKVVGLLRQAGVGPGPTIDGQPPTGPALTVDDLIDLGLDLAEL